MIRILFAAAAGLLAAIAFLPGRAPLPSRPRAAIAPAPLPPPPPPTTVPPVATLLPAPVATRRAVPLAVLGEQLSIDRSTLDLMIPVIDAGQDEFFALLRRPRPGGGSWAEDFATPGAPRGETLLKLFTDDAPGSGEKYATRIARVQRRIRDGLRPLVTPAQFEMLEKLAPDPLEIAAGRNPFADYCRTRGVAPLSE